MQITTYNTALFLRTVPLIYVPLLYGLFLYPVFENCPLFLFCYLVVSADEVDCKRCEKSGGENPTRYVTKHLTVA